MINYVKKLTLSQIVEAMWYHNYYITTCISYYLLKSFWFTGLTQKKRTNFLDCYRIQISNLFQSSLHCILFVDSYLLVQKLNFHLRRFLFALKRCLWKLAGIFHTEVYAIAGYASFSLGGKGQSISTNQGVWYSIRIRFTWE